ncbi:MAG TPA: hypothetical protein VGA75_04360 [Paracoccaceae bacterium]
MTKGFIAGASLLIVAVLGGCADGHIAYVQSPDTVIATTHDRGRDKIGLTNGNAAIAYDPDGCQGWIMDDGVEGYSGRRFDPVSGLPVCDGRYPPGTVLKDFQTQSPGMIDRVPEAGARQVSP